MPERRRYERTPDTVMVLGACAVTATALTVSGFVPGSVLAVAPYWLGLAWSGGLAFAASVALAGVLWREATTGWLLELAGRAGLTLTAAGYVYALLRSVTATGSALIIMLVSAIAVSSGVRVWQVYRRLTQVREAIRGVSDE